MRSAGSDWKEAGIRTSSCATGREIGVSYTFASPAASESQSWMARPGT